MQTTEIEYKKLEKSDLKNFFVNHYNGPDTDIKVETNNNILIFKGTCKTKLDDLDKIYEYIDNQSYLKTVFQTPFVFFTDRFNDDRIMKMYIYNDGKVVKESNYNLTDLGISIDSKKYTNLESIKQKREEEQRKQEEKKRKQEEEQRKQEEEQRKQEEEQRKQEEEQRKQERSREIKQKLNKNRQLNNKLEEENQIKNKINDIISESNTAYTKLIKTPTEDEIQKFYNDYNLIFYTLLQENKDKNTVLLKYILEKKKQMI